jgi:hypothetical protein
MSSFQNDRSPDEQVYQENKDELEVEQVYTTPQGETPVTEQLPDDVPTKDEVDEISAESFPASDSPPNTPPAAPSKDE